MKFSLSETESSGQPSTTNIHLPAGNNFDPLSSHDDTASYERAQAIEFQPLWQLPNPLRCFSGRKLQLSRLNDAFQKQQQHWVIQHPKKITGTGGIGKTQLAVQFAHNMVQQGRFKNIIWINADTSVGDRLSNEFTLLANALHLNTRQRDFAQVVRNIYQRLEQLGETLVVFDSAASYEDLQSYLPPKEFSISVLVTTRDSNPWSSLFEQLPLDIFTIDEALEFIKKVLKPEQFVSKQAEDLAELLGRFPLGLAQATAYILTRNITIEQYTALFRAKQSTQQALLDKRPLQADPHQETIWLTVNLCLEQISSTKTRDILLASSNLAAESPIDIELLQYWVQGADPVYQNIKELQSYSLIEEGNADIRYVRIHQLVQHVVMLILAPSENTQVCQLIEASENVQRYYQSPIETRIAHKRLIRLLPHIRKVVGKLTNSSENDILTRERKNGLITSSEMASGHIYEITGDYPAQKQSFQNALNVTESLPNSTNKSQQLIRIYNNLANAYGSIGDYERKTQYLHQAMDLNNKLYGGELNSEILVPIANLANAYGLQGNFHKKIELLEGAIYFSEALDNPDQLTLAKNLGNLADAYSELNDYDEAEKLYNRSIAIFTTLYGNDDPETLKQISNLASLYTLTKRSDRAIPILENAKIQLAAHFGSQHIVVSRIQTALARAYINTNNNHKSVELCRDTLKIKRDFFKDKHPETAKAQLSLAECLRSIGNTQEALQLYNEAIPIIKSYYGVVHIFTIQAMFNYALCLIAMKNYNPCEVIFNEIIKNAELCYGKDSENLVSYIKAFAAFYALQDKYSQAIGLFDRALILKKNASGNDHPETAVIKVETASALLLSQLDLARAKALCQEAVESLSGHASNPEYQSHLDIARKNISMIDSLVGMTTSPRNFILEPTTKEIDTPIIDGLLDLAIIDTVETICTLVEQCIEHYHFQLALALLRTLEEHNHLSLKICELVIQCALKLNYLESATSHIQIAFELGASDHIINLHQQVTQAQEQKILIIKQKDGYLKNWYTNTISPKEVVQLSIQCSRLGEYEEALKFLQHPSLVRAPDNICAGVNYQRARCSLMLGNYADAVEFIRKSLALNDAPQAQALRDQIYCGAQCNRKLIAIAKKIAWNQLPECDSEINNRLIF